MDRIQVGRKTLGNSRFMPTYIKFRILNCYSAPKYSAIQIKVSTLTESHCTIISSSFHDAPWSFHSLSWRPYQKHHTQMIKYCSSVEYFIILPGHSMCSIEISSNSHPAFINITRNDYWPSYFAWRIPCSENFFSNPGCYTGTAVRLDSLHANWWEG